MPPLMRGLIKQKTNKMETQSEKLKKEIDIQLQLTMQEIEKLKNNIVLLHQDTILLKNELIKIKKNKS